MADRQERLLMRQRGAGTRQVKDLEFQLTLPGQPAVPPVPLKPQKSGRSRTPQPDLPRRTPRRTTPSTQLLPQRSSRRTPASALNKRVGKPSSSSIATGEDQKGVSGTLATLREESAPKKWKPVATVADEASRSVGLHTDPEQPSRLPDTNEVPSQIGSVKSQGKKRKKRISIGQYSKKRPKLESKKKAPKTVTQQRIEVQESANDVTKAQETAAQPIIEALESANSGQAAVAEPRDGGVKDEPLSPAPAVILGTLDQVLQLEDLSDAGAGNQDTPLENLLQEPDAENGGQNLSTTSLKPPTGNKPKRKKRKAIGQQKPRKKITPATAKAVQLVPLPAATPRLADPEENSTIEQARGKDLPKKISTAHVSRVRIVPTRGKVGPRARLARGRVPWERLSTADVGQEDCNKDRNEEGPGGVDYLAIEGSGPSNKEVTHENRNEQELRGAEGVAIKTNSKLRLHPQSKAPKTSVPSKRRPTVKKYGAKGGPKKIPPALDDNVQDLSSSSKDKSITRLTRSKRPRGQLSTAEVGIQKEEGEELGEADRVASKKRSRSNPEDDDAYGDEEVERVDTAADKKRSRLNRDDEDEEENGEDLGKSNHIALEAKGKPNQVHNGEHSNGGEEAKVDRLAIKKTVGSKPRPPSKAKTSNDVRSQKPRPRNAPRKPPENTIPITVYRITSNHDLDPDTDDPNSLTDLSRFPKNNSVNAVDVLAQVCREQVSKTYDSVSDAVKKERQTSQKAALERKGRTIKMYGDELDHQLFNLTKTLDANNALISQLRRVRKEERNLRSELKSVQREREELAQEKAQIQEARDKSQARKKLYVLLKDIENAVQQGRELDAQGADSESGRAAVKIWNPEILLREAAKDANSAMEGEDRLLARVKGLDELLRKAVEVM